MIYAIPKSLIDCAYHILAESSVSVSAQQTALSQYKTHGYAINNALRSFQSKRPIIINHETDTPTTVNLHHLDVAFNTHCAPADNDMVLYRGMKSHIPVPTEYTEKGFTSLSSDESIAKQYAGEDGIVYKIHVPKGTSILTLGNHVADAEDETILARGTCFTHDGQGNIHVDVTHKNYNKKI